jgi:hypothetical protein
MKAHKELITYLSANLWNVSPRGIEVLLEGYNGKVFAEPEEETQSPTLERYLNEKSKATLQP